MKRSVTLRERKSIFFGRNPDFSEELVVWYRMSRELVATVLKVQAQVIVESNETLSFVGDEIRDDEFGKKFSEFHESNRIDGRNACEDGE